MACKRTLSPCMARVLEWLNPLNHGAHALNETELKLDDVRHYSVYTNATNMSRDCKSSSISQDSSWASFDKGSTYLSSTA